MKKRRNSLSRDELTALLDERAAATVDNSAYDYIIELQGYDLTWEQTPAWKGYDVYSPIFKEPVYIGLPYVILVNDCEARRSTPDESLEYLTFTSK